MHADTNTGDDSFLVDDYESDQENENSKLKETIHAYFLLFTL